ncbi:MAG: endopeptidase La, partial [Candidatus Eisenbacteria bacterium]|nr:endopeptidase La [Candidatus Eisenbacteria bacterium]
LSRVLFLTTANLLDAIPEPLRDRLEIIRLPGYLEAEKLQIARGYLAPRQLEANGLRTGDLELPDETILRLIRGYTREAGVRGLERQIARVCRRTALHKAGGREAAFGDARPPRGRRALGLRVEPAQLDGLLGAAPHAERAQPAERSGVATGLAWTESGGEVLSVECSALPGRGRLLLTGKLGATMRESARAALTFVRSRAGALGIDPNFQRHMDIHIHIPEGAIPKDGPSAGVTMALALASALTGAPTRTRTAMTGEITLRGRVLPVGGLAEKLVAARRAGVEQVFLPRANEPQLLELPAQLREGLALRLVETMDQILEGALEAPGAPAEGAAGDLDPGRARAA